MKNHNRVVSLHVIKKILFFSSNFIGLENINSQTFFKNKRIKGLFLKPSKKLAVHALSDLKHFWSFFKHYLTNDYKIN